MKKTYSIHFEISGRIDYLQPEFVVDNGALNFIQQVKQLGVALGFQIEEIYNRSFIELNESDRTLLRLPENIINEKEGKK